MRFVGSLALALALALPPAAIGAPSVGAQTLRVGPGQPLTTIAAAARVARDGDVVEIEAGDYTADVAIWDRARLTLRGIGGRPRLIASGAAAEGKAIWVVRRGEITVENIEFTGARVPDRNGAGIRLEGGYLTVRGSRFVDNENGILVGNDPTTSLTIENSEFGHNGAGDGQSHDLYVGGIDRLIVTGSHFHHAVVGHLLKSRARENRICHNRFVDGPGGRASYELEFPNGGIADVVGNLIGQGAGTENPTLVSYGVEGYKWPLNRLRMAANTLVNERPRGGTFVRVAPRAGPGGPASAQADEATPTVIARDNRFVGRGQRYVAAVAVYAVGDSDAEIAEAARILRDDDPLANPAASRARASAVDAAGACGPAPGAPR